MVFMQYVKYNLINLFAFLNFWLMKTFVQRVLSTLVLLLINNRLLYTMWNKCFERRSTVSVVPRHVLLPGCIQPIKCLYLLYEALCALEIFPSQTFNQW